MCAPLSEVHKNGSGMLSLPPLTFPTLLSPLLLFQWTFGKLGQMESALCLYNCYNSSNNRRIQVKSSLISLPFSEQYEKQPHFLFIFQDNKAAIEEAHLPLFSVFLLCITASTCTCWLFAIIEDVVTLCLIFGISKVAQKSKFWELYQDSKKSLSSVTSLLKILFDVQTQPFSTMPQNFCFPNIIEVFKGHVQIIRRVLEELF